MTETSVAMALVKVAVIVVGACIGVGAVDLVRHGASGPSSGRTKPVS